MLLTEEAVEEAVRNKAATAVQWKTMTGGSSGSYSTWVQ